MLTPFPLVKFVISSFFSFLPFFLMCPLKAFDICLLNSQLTLAFLEESPSGFLKFLFLVSVLSLLTLSILHELRKFAITGKDGLTKIRLNERKKNPKPFTIKALMSLQVLKDLLRCNSQTCKLIMETPDQCNVNSERFLP